MRWPWCIAILAATTGAAFASSGAQLAQAIDQRAEGQALQQTMTMTLENKHGQQRVRTANYYRSNASESRQTLVRFAEPARIRNTAFLTHDHVDATRADDQWMYLPALNKPRRISATERGNYFFGTDFTYEDMKAATKFSLLDYEFKLLAPDTLAQLLGAVAGHLQTENPQQTAWQILEARPKNKKIAKELGYSRVVARIHPTALMPVNVIYWDTKQRPVKQVRVSGIQQIQNIWTATQFEATNLRSGHKTRLLFSNIRYANAFQAALFTRHNLGAGR